MERPYCSTFLEIVATPHGLKPWVCQFDRTHLGDRPSGECPSLEQDILRSVDITVSDKTTGGAHVRTNTEGLSNKLSTVAIVMCCALSRIRAAASQGKTILLTLLLCLDDFDSILTAIEVPPGFGALLQYLIQRLNILYTLILKPATQSG